MLTRPRSGLLLAAAAWTAYVWVTRLGNLASDERSRTDGALNAFFWVHVAVAAVSLAFAVALAWLGVRGWRAASRAASGTEERQPGEEEPVRPAGRSARA